MDDNSKSTNPFTNCTSEDVHGDSLDQNGGRSRECDEGSLNHQINSSLSETLASTKRSMRVLEESEKIGISTAKDLHRQGEQLRNADNHIAKFPRVTNETQRHLRGTRNLLGSAMNAMSGEASKSRNGMDKSQTLGNDGICRSLDKLNSNNCKDLGETESVLLSDHSATGQSTSNYYSLSENGQECKETKVEENLASMSSPLSRLQEIGVALGNELDDQNEVIDRISKGAERSNIVIRSQNEQANDILH